MSGRNSKFILIAIIICVILISAGCSALGNSGATGEGAASNADQIEIQSVPTVTATTSSRPTNTPKPTLRTEIAEPISPILPVSPVVLTGQSTVSTTNNSVQPILGSEEALAASIKDLSDQTGSSPDEIMLVSIEAVEWSDSSLGCPQEGFMYAQVITPGYKIVLETQGQQYNYHTDQATNVVLCQE